MNRCVSLPDNAGSFMKESVALPAVTTTSSTTSNRNSSGRNWIPYIVVVHPNDHVLLRRQWQQMMILLSRLLRNVTAATTITPQQQRIPTPNDVRMLRWYAQPQQHLRPSSTSLSILRYPSHSSCSSWLSLMLRFLLIMLVAATITTPTINAFQVAHTTVSTSTRSNYNSNDRIRPNHRTVATAAAVSSDYNTQQQHQRQLLLESNELRPQAFQRYDDRRRTSTTLMTTPPVQMLLQQPSPPTTTTTKSILVSKQSAVWGRFVPSASNTMRTMNERSSGGSSSARRHVGTTRGILGFQLQPQNDAVADTIGFSSSSNTVSSTVSKTSSLSSTKIYEQHAGEISNFPRHRSSGIGSNKHSSIYDSSNPFTSQHDIDEQSNTKQTMGWLEEEQRLRRGGSSSNRLHASLISNVDPMAWNLPERLIGLSRTTAASSWEMDRSNNNNEVGSNDVNRSSGTGTSTVAILPWIPTETDIDQLTVVQLKSELGIRDLKKVGNKYLLQRRFKEWIQNIDSNKDSFIATTTNTALRRRSSSSTTTSDGSTSSSTTKVASFLEDEILTWGIDSSSFLPDSKRDDTTGRSTTDDDETQPLLNVDSLQEWARTVDLEPLLHRREAIHREKLVGPPKKDRSSSNPSKQHMVNKQLPSDLRLVIQKMFDQPSSIYSNWEVKQMYAAAKHADQIGDRILSKRILYELKGATPNDARIYRRLARMETEDANVMVARTILDDGIRLHPENAYLWHGLGQLEGSLGNVTAQRSHWEKAIEVDPHVPNSYHALGILDHTCGRVANAMKVLKKGIQYCPTNHRLHHALGDLYRDAKLLPLARMSYQKAIQYGPLVSHGFAYTALSYVAYEEGNIDQCRHYLRKAVHLNNGRHANGWVALAQMEESERNVEAARTACMVGIGQYERGLIEQSRRTIQQQQININTNSTNNRRTLSLNENPVTLRNKILQTIPTYRSGDRFFNVYRNWLRLEERYGTIDSVEEVYERAIVAFPNEYKIMIDAAQYFVRLNMFTRARDAFSKACAVRVNHPNVHAEPYRLFAEFEMENGNFMEAQKILYSGAMTLSKYSSLAMNTSRRGLPQLVLTWAVCEWHLNNFIHAETLFDYALRLTSSEAEETPTLRSMILYSMSRFEYDKQELRRAQHYVGLCLQENSVPGGNSQVWDLWATIAYEMGNIKLAHQCQEQSSLARPLEQNHGTFGTNYATRIDDNTIKTLSDTLKSSTMNDCRDMIRRDPWHSKIFNKTAHDRNHFVSVSLLPRSEGHIAIQRR